MCSAFEWTVSDDDDDNDDDGEKLASQNYLHNAIVGIDSDEFDSNANGIQDKTEGLLKKSTSKWGIEWIFHFVYEFVVKGKSFKVETYKITTDRIRWY